MNVKYKHAPNTILQDLFQLKKKTFKSLSKRVNGSLNKTGIKRVQTPSTDLQKIFLKNIRASIMNNFTCIVTLLRATTTELIQKNTSI